MRRIIASITIIPVLCLPLAHPGEAASVNPANAACRSAIAKASGKLGSTIMKAFDGCLKNATTSGAGDCTTAASADSKLKIPGARDKLSAAVSAKCSDAGTTVALAEQVRCGPPVGSPIASFADVNGCLDDLLTQNVEHLRAAVLDPDVSIASPACVNAIAKSTSKLFKTVQKTYAKGIGLADKSGGDSSYHNPGDPSGKIAGVIGGVLDAIAAACSGLSSAGWAAVGSCGLDVTSVQDCVIARVRSTAEGLLASAYDQPGICPAQVSVTFRDRAAGSAALSSTELDLGGSGFGHNEDFTDGTRLRVALDCGANSDNDCTACNMSLSCEEGNCRCQDDVTRKCSNPFGPDLLCGGSVCRMFLGPPLPMHTGGTPFCWTNALDTQAVGAANAASGGVDVTVMLRSSVFSGITHDRPCPTCAQGLCDGGDRDGLPCSVDADSDFAAMSFDCPPDGGKNLTGAGLRYPLALTDGARSLPFGVPCDPPLESRDCACSTCSLDNSIPCNSDSECAAAGAGVCRTDGLHGGVSRVPNGCNGSCDPVGSSEEGECTAGPFDQYCDGYVQGDGGGILGCFNNSDCGSYGVAGAGNCTLSQPRKCFLDPVDVVGDASPLGSVLGAVLCIPPSGGNAFVNGAYGLPGPARMKLATDFTAYCADGVTPWTIGGASCQ